MALFAKNNQSEESANRPEEPTSQSTDLIDLISPSGLKISPNYFEMAGKFGRAIFVFTYPRTLNMDWLLPLITLDQEMNISLFIHPTETNLVLKKLTKKTARVQAQIGLDMEKGKVRDPLMETALIDIEGLRDRLQQGTEKLFSFGLYITFFADSLKELDEIENRIRALLETQMIYAKPALCQQEQGLVSTLPLGKDQLSIHTSLNTEPLSSTFPFVSSSLTDNKGVLYGVNRHNNSLVLFDRFSLENYNFTIFGVAGGGKSYFAKLEILRSLIQGTDVIVIDPEKEYKYLAEIAGGGFIDISLTSDYHINPFDLPLPGPDDKPANLLGENILTLTGLLKIMLGSLSPEEEAIIDKALNETYASRDITPQSDFSQIKPPLMQDLYAVLKSMVGAESLAIRLEKFVSGSYAGFFNQPTNVDLNRKLVVFSIRDMADELRPMAMYMIVHYIWNMIHSRIKKRILVVDEAWLMMQNEAGASFLLSIAKRARKYYLGLTTVTQDVPDFMKSKYGQPILTNSALRLLMKQSPATIKTVQETFNLTEHEKNMLLGASVGDGIFFAGSEHIMMQVLASYAEDQVITSDPAQLEAIEKAKQELAQQNNA